MSEDEKQRAEDKSREYLMIRDEILQYLDKYQTVRNMMYVVSATLLGFGIKEVNGNIDRYIFLLPLIVIIPSYIIAIDYWECVRKAAAYLIVFHEEEGSVFHWESRSFKLGNEIKFFKINRQLIPYYICGITSIILYFVFLGLNNQDRFIGIGVSSISFIIMLYFRKRLVSFETYIKGWKSVKGKEKGTDIRE